MADIVHVEWELLHVGNLLLEQQNAKFSQVACKIVECKKSGAAISNWVLHKCQLLVIFES